MFIRHRVGSAVRHIKTAAAMLAVAGLLGLGTAAIVSAPAAAFTKVPIPGTRTKEEIKDLCRTSGGNYSEGQGQYGCMSNCGDSKQTSDACGINCSEETHECYGWSPATERKPPSTPEEALKPPPDDSK
ncbi:MAG TPA: hypothetical protein VLX44_19835 [Xanthobacteraceae bacterium]|nr:hypothetical protein [Xanthobacteraceae bacterium]